MPEDNFALPESKCVACLDHLSFGIWGNQIVLNTLCNVAKESWPDIRHKLRHRN